MRDLTRWAAAVVGVVALLGTAGCADAGNGASTPTEGSGPTRAPEQVPADNTVAPEDLPSDLSSIEVVTATPTQSVADASTEKPTLAATEVANDAPSGGAVARVGNREEPVESVSCTEIDGVWAASGGEPDSTMVAVRTAAGDGTRVDSASVIFPDGIVAQVQPEVGEASIERDGDSFTVTGTAQRLNLNDETQDAVEVPFVIQASCPA